MSEPASSPLPRLIHSVLGLVPLALFVVVHLIQVGTRAPSLQAVGEPGVLAYGLGGAFVMHGVYGLWLLGKRRDNVGRLPTARNWIYSLSRWSAPVILWFVGYHAVGAHVMGVHDHLAQSAMGVPGVWLYGIGLTAVVLHVGRGLWSASVNLGIATSAAARQRVAYLTIMISLGLLALGAVGIWRARA